MRLENGASFTWCNAEFRLHRLTAGSFHTYVRVSTQQARGAGMRRTTDPPKTNITLVVASLATAAFTIWMANFAAPPDSLYTDAAREPPAGSAPTYAASAPRGLKAARAHAAASRG